MDICEITGEREGGRERDRFRSMPVENVSVAKTRRNPRDPGGGGPRLAELPAFVASTVTFRRLLCHYCLLPRCHEMI